MIIKRSRGALAFAALAFGVGTPASVQAQAQAQSPIQAAGLAFDHFYMAISVQDMEAVSAFYVEKLGFKVEKNAALGEAVQFRWLTNGTARVELIRMAGSQAGPARQTPPRHIGVQGFSHLALETRDIAGTRAALVAAGVTTASQISELAPLGMKAMFVLDPEGNPIEIIERLPA